MSTIDMTPHTQEPSQSDVSASDMMMVEFERLVVENNIVRSSDGLWNLTAFGKLFSKEFKDWYQTKHAKQFVEAVQASEPGRDVLALGISHTPTWGHYKIASDMLYQSNVAYAVWVPIVATRYTARDATLATEVDRRVGACNKRSHDEVYDATPVSVLDPAAMQLVALAPDDKKIERLAKRACELLDALHERGHNDPDLAAYDELKTLVDDSRVAEAVDRIGERRVRKAEDNAKAAADASP